ncbi:hypothetical protein [Thermus brockianus]|uniref:hypothetical protein n=1 Tax=Thermus brockianus TaxID=56956 RepID=UPI001F2A17FB|nr:hypothetical protein [Thermus brockianus]
MIHVVYIPQVALPGHTLTYSWAARVLTARLQRGEEVLEEVYDLSGLSPGDTVIGVEPEVMSFSPLISVWVDDDHTLHVRLLRWYEGPEPDVLEEVLDG